MKLKSRFILVSLLLIATVISMLFNVIGTFHDVAKPAPRDVSIHRVAQDAAVKESSNNNNNNNGNPVLRKLTELRAELKSLKEYQKNSSHRSVEDQADFIIRNHRSDSLVQDIIGLGKALEQHVGDPDETEFDEDDPESNVVEDPKPAVREKSAAIPFPEFHFDPVKFTSLVKYVDSQRHNHTINRKRKLMINPKRYTIHKASKKSKLWTWQIWQNNINQFGVYEEKDLSKLLHGLSHQRIVGMSSLSDQGTELKVIFELADGFQTIFKPMRMKRDQERDPNWFVFDDFERHHAEIAAFHLDWALGFYRVPPNAGRFVNITLDIERFASRSFRKTIYTSPAGNRCFYGKCEYYCDSGHPACAFPELPDIVEGSCGAWLPQGKTITEEQEHPWIRSYSKRTKAPWESDPNYCDIVKKRPPYNTGRRLLDIMDITIFDFLAVNQDRHHYDVVTVFGNFSSPILYDNGRGFGFIHSDDMMILTPLVHCCQIRYTTLRRLLAFESGGDNLLSARMRKSLLQDPLSSGIHGPVLAEGHLRALDRRVSKVLDAVWDCVSVHGYESVILDDGF